MNPSVNKLEFQTQKDVPWIDYDKCTEKGKRVSKVRFEDDWLKEDLEYVVLF